jgi:hypothetical protein
MAFCATITGGGNLGAHLRQTLLTLPLQRRRPGRRASFSAPGAPSPADRLNLRFARGGRCSRRSLTRFDGRAVSTEMTHQFFTQMFLDQRLMPPFGQTPWRQFL